MGKIQHKLVQVLLLTSTLPLIILAVIAIFFLDKMAINDMRERLKNGLSVSMSIYDNVCGGLKYIVRDQNRRVYTLINEDQIDLLKNEYRKVVKSNKLDFFIVTDKRGKVIVSMNNPELEGRSLARDPYVHKALFKGQFNVSTEILSAEELNKFGLLDKAEIPGIENTEALIIRSTFPVINQNEIVVGSMVAGYLLNNNNGIIVELIKKDTGLVSSIFMGNTRICSNVPSQGNEYAIGSKFDSARAKYVLEEGKDYIGHIWVMKEKYLAAYTPIFNGDKRIIGILGIGLPEKSVFWLRDSLTKMFIIAVLCSVVLALIFGFYRGGSIVFAIRKLRSGMEAVIKGNYEHRIKVNSKDEIEELSDYFNKMISRLQAATKELTETEKRLIQSERMAAIGRMAAVLSHELKNVFAGIQTSAYYLKGKIAKNHPELPQSFRDIEEEIGHANNIIEGVLNFTRPKNILLGEADLNEIIEDALASLEKQGLFKKIEVVKELDPNIPVVNVDKVQMKEVFLNLVINAVQAMPEGGELTLITRQSEKFLEAEVIDNGLGIPEENLEKLFIPFFTTKSKGLGLGLCIIKEIVEKHGGTVEVKAGLNKTTSFIVKLPLRGLG